MKIGCERQRSSCTFLKRAIVIWEVFEFGLRGALLSVSQAISDRLIWSRCHTLPQRITPARGGIALASWASLRQVIRLPRE